MRDYRRLKVFPKAHDLVLLVYRRTRTFPADERFGLVAQMRRAACSIAANLAEGSGRGSQADFARFVDMSIGSGTELKYFVRLSGDLDYLAPHHAHEMNEQVEEILRMLVGLGRALTRSAFTSRDRSPSIRKRHRGDGPTPNRSGRPDP